ncbi:hypothetical protein Tco_1146813 [Tanacetum coccineum]
MSDNILSFDIQREIIKRVPDVKSLIRFRPFQNNGSRSLTAPSLSLVTAPDPLSHDVSFPHQQLDFSPNVPDLVKQLYNSKVIGSSCGLWCFHGFKNFKPMIVIWNPSIRKSVGIVVPWVLTNSFNKMTDFGFRLCPSTNDPIVVGISKCFWKDKHKVGIFTLSSKTWKMIPTSNVLGESVTFKFSTQLAIDRKHAPRHISISKLNESLVVCGYTAEVYGVWIMGEEGRVMTSFTKLFNINTPYDPPVRKVLGFTMSGELVMETKNHYGEYENDGYGARCGARYDEFWKLTMKLWS